MNEPYCQETYDLHSSNNDIFIATHSNGSNCVNHVPVSQIVMPSTSTHNEQRIKTTADQLIGNRQLASSNNDKQFTNGDLIDLNDHTMIDCYHSQKDSNGDLVEAINERLLQDLYQRKSGRLDNVIGDEEQRSETVPNYTTELNTSSKCRLSNVQSMEQHQTAIREFKRLGMYCTLRPDQRRKHLLKVLPNLRNSVLLQTLLATNMDKSTVPSSNTNNNNVLDNSNNNNNNNDSNRDITSNSNALSWGYNDVDSLLLELDDFIIDRNTTMQHGCEKDNATAIESSTWHSNDANANRIHSDDNNRTGIHIDPDKVEDCLLELDAYLEEIDRDYASVCAGVTHNRKMCVTNNSQASKGNKTNSKCKHNSCSGDTSVQQAAHCSLAERTTRDYINCLLGIDNSHWFNSNDDSTEASTMLTDAFPNKPNSSVAHQSITKSDMFDNDIDMFTTMVTPQNHRHRSNSDACMTLDCIADDEDNDSDGGCNEWYGATSNQQRKPPEQRSQPLKRGYKLRNTIASFDRCDQPTGSNNGESASNSGGQQFGKRKLESTAVSWRRLSMRKTCPIDMPEQSVGTNRISNIESINDFIECSDTNYNTLCASPILQNNDQLSANNTNSVQSVDYAGNRSNDVDSLNNEILTTILSTQLYQDSADSASMNGSHLADRRSIILSSNDCGLPTMVDGSRPRQMGRRSEFRSRVVSITAERTSEGNQQIIVNCDTDSMHGRPSNGSNTMNVLNQLSQQPSIQQHLTNQCQYMISEPSSGASSRNPSPISLGSSSESSSGGSTSAGEANIRTSPHRTNEMDSIPPAHAISSNNNTSSGNNSTSNNSNNNTQRTTNTKSNTWPFGPSRIFAATCCTLGLFNLSRFSIFSILFGANFIVQFLILSILFGIPMLWLQMCLGASIKGGPISMWRVSPICKGIGIALVLVQMLMTIYSSVSIAWLLFYVRDACVSTRYPFYRWQEIFEFFRGPSDNGIAIVTNTSEPSAASAKLGETVADYFNGIILQRYQLGPGGRIASGSGIGAVRFQLAFNLTIIWLIVFVMHCKGIRLYGKFVVALVVLPIMGLIAITIKMLTLLNLNGFLNIFPATDWQDFFVNSQSWLSAAQETFLTWSLLGATIVSIFSKTTKHQQTTTTSGALRRDACSIVAITLFGLLVAAVFGNACVQILIDRGFFYFPGSFETLTSSVFLLPSSKPTPAQLATSLSKWLPRYSTFLGESYKRGDSESGWQPIRLIVEILPATLAAATLDNISSIWSLFCFLLFAVFAIAQMCIMWMPIANALCSYSESISATSTTTLLTCLAGLLLGIPLTTESGINIIYFLDSVIGGAWFVLLLWTGQIFAVFLVRGRPYSGDMLVNDLRLGQSLSAFIAFSWNLLIPIGLLTLCVLQYKISYSYDFYHWSGIVSQSYWPVWTRKVAAFIQIGIFQIIPITAIVQTYRYLSKGPPDILDRFQLLYRPSISSAHVPHRYPIPRTARSPHVNRPMNNTTDSTAIPAIDITSDSSPVSLVLDDAPPKYTPPPSYTTATGARIAKILRNSIRRSVRRLLGEQSTVRRQRTPLQTQTAECAFDQYQSPPDYTTIVTAEPNHQPAPIYSLQYESALSQAQNAANEQCINTNEHQNNVTTTVQSNRQANRRYTTTNFPCQKTMEKMDSFSLTMPRRQASSGPNSILSERSEFRNLTAQDVAQLLRSTHRTSPNIAMPIIGTTHSIAGADQEDFSLTRSIEELVLNEVPPNRTSYIEPINESTTCCDKII